MSPRYRILCYLIIVKKVILVALLMSHDDVFAIVPMTIVNVWKTHFKDRLFK